MLKATLLKRLATLESEGGRYVQKLFDKDFDGACPCFSGKFTLEGRKCEVWGRCWRVSENEQDLHVLMPRDVAEAIKRCLDKQEWYNPYTIIEHDEPFLT